MQMLKHGLLTVARVSCRLIIDGLIVAVILFVICAAIEHSAH
jgi:hypothetical protein